MKSPKIYAAGFFALLLLALIAGSWAGTYTKTRVVANDLEYIFGFLDEGMSEVKQSTPEEGVDQFLTEAQKPRFAKYAMVNFAAFRYADVYYPELTTWLYKNAMKNMGLIEMRSFIAIMGDRILEVDRVRFATANYPDEVMQRLEERYENRQIIDLSPDETAALIECKEDLDDRGFDPRSNVQKWFNKALDDKSGCHDLWSMYH